MPNMFLSHEDSKKIHEYALQLLENTGVKLGHKEAVKMVVDAGGKQEGDRVKIPRELVEKMLENNIPVVQMHDRNGNPVMKLEASGKTHFGTGSDALYQIDIDTDEKRFSTLNDIANNMKLVDKLDMYDFVMSTGLPQPNEVDKDNLYKKVFETMARNTVKPIISTLTSLHDIKEIHKSALELAGDWIKEKPYFMAYVEPISPLIMDDEGVDRLLYCAEHRIPFCYAAGANCGSGAPVTLEGGVIQGTAEFLGGYVIAKLKNPKALTVYGANTSAVDPNTMLVRYGCPEWFKTVAVYADMGRFYNMPSWGTGSSTDALNMTPLAAWEAQQGTSMALQSGVSIVHDVAYYDHGRIYDPKMILLVNEIIKRERFIRRELNFDDEYLKEAIDVVNEVATNEGVLYPVHMHTAKYLRKSLYVLPKYLRANKNYIDSLREEVKKLWTE